MSKLIRVFPNFFNVYGMYIVLRNAKFKASSYILWLYSPVCVGPGRHPEDRFCDDAAYHIPGMNLYYPPMHIIISSFIANTQCVCFTIYVLF